MGFDHVKLEKGMYRESGKTFTQVLESLDPSENYKGTALEGTDAFQRQLKRFDIHAKGAYSDPVEKFFRTMDSSVLFPEYIARAVKQGMEENNVLPKITASTTTIDAMDYQERLFGSLRAGQDAHAGIRGREHSGNPGQDEGKPCQAQQARQNARRVL